MSAQADFSITQCLQEHPEAVKSALTIAHYGQSILYGLTVSTRKVVKGTGLIPVADGSDFKPDGYLVMQSNGLSYYMTVEVTDEDADPDDLAKMKLFIEKLIACDEAFPNVTADDLEALYDAGIFYC